MAMQDKTEPATPRKREEARNEGRVARSSDLNSALGLLACILVLKTAGPYMFNGIMTMTRDTFGRLHLHDISTAQVRELMGGYIIGSTMLCLPIMLGAAAVGLAANVLQVGFKSAPKAITPKFNRLNPLQGIVRLLSLRSFVELVKSVAKVCIVGYVVYAFLRVEFPVLLDLSMMPPAEAGSVLGGLCFRMLVRACIAILAIGILDYAYQRYHYEKSLMMTKQEVKDEFKRMEGDPAVKARIRQRQRDISRSRILSEVPQAHVIITNPTHIAVAIKYEPDSMTAPTVVAKGQRLMAEKIKSIAEANGVPIVENVQIARLLYKLVDVGGQIPEELYQTVAEILAFVYRTSDRARSLYKAS